MTDLRMTKVPKAARATLRCTRGCDVRQTLAPPPLAFDEMVGQSLAAGDQFEIRVTRPAPRKPGRYRFGAIGQLFIYKVDRGSITRSERCFYPESKKPRKRCPQERTRP